MPCTTRTATNTHVVLCFGGLLILATLFVPSDSMPTKAADLELLRRLELGIQQARKHLAQRIASANTPKPEPRVARRYDHNCFFTPMNCMVGRTPSSSSFVQIGGHIIPAKVLLE